MTQSKTVLHHYLNTELQVVLTHDLTEDYSWQDWTESVNEDSFKQGALWTLSGFTDPQLMISSGEGELSEYILQRENRTWISVDSKSFKPALHSMNSLTMPLENGEIPILILAKIATRQEWFMNNGKCVNSGYEFAYQNDSFIINSFHGEISVPAQLQIFQYLYANHFNVHNLPESEYIEKSTLKL